MVFFRVLHSDHFDVLVFSHFYCTIIIIITGLYGTYSNKKMHSVAYGLNMDCDSIQSCLKKNLGRISDFAGIDMGLTSDTLFDPGIRSDASRVKSLASQITRCN
jgi:hypothetical protein